MLIFVTCKSLKVLLNYELVDKGFTVPKIHRYVPDGGDNRDQRNSPQSGKQQTSIRPFFDEKKIESDNSERKYQSDQTFCQQGDPDEEVKAKKLVPATSIGVMNYESCQRCGYRKRNDDVETCST